MKVILSPPWYTFANEIKNTYGLSKYINVDDPIANNGDYVLNIKVSSFTIANALRAILPIDKEFGNVRLIINIYDNSGNLVPPSNQVYTDELLAKTFCTALYKNPLFVGTVLTVGKLPPDYPNTIGDVVIIINSEVISFFNDDISDLCGNSTEVAAKVFYGVTTLQYPDNLSISFTTYDQHCALQRDTICKNYNNCCTFC